MVRHWRAARGILRRESLRTIGQHGRLAAAIVRPLIWLAVFAAGFRAVLGLSITPPYQTYVLYEVYIVPGLACMMLLFNGLQTSLSMVYDREMGSMRTLLLAPLPRWFLLGVRLLANVLSVIPLVVLFLLLARLWDVRPPLAGYLAVLPALVAAGLMLGAFGLLLSSLVPRLENFAGVMNFVIFPMFFASSALYPLWRLREASEALYLKFEPVALTVVAVTLVAFFTLAIYAYDPGRGLWMRRGDS